MATTFANHAAIALELADARADQQRMVLLEDRDRIARDLHDHVIQRLFATGLTVQSVRRACASRRDRREASDRWSPTSTRRSGRSGRRSSSCAASLGPEHGTRCATRLLEVVAELSRAARIRSRRRASPVRSTPWSPDALGDDLVAVLREALTQRRPARAGQRGSRSPSTATGDQLDARGHRRRHRHRRRRRGAAGWTTCGSGPNNTAARRDLRRSAVRITATATGTRLQWTIPLS